MNQREEASANSNSPSSSSSAAVAAASAVYEDQAFLGSQSGTALLDKFTHCLLVKCPEGMLDRLLETLIRHLQSGVASDRRVVNYWSAPDSGTVTQYNQCTLLT